MKKLFSIAWLVAFFTLALFFYSRREAIEAHQLHAALQFGRDSFGRECIALTLVAAVESFKAAIPVGLFSLGLSLLAASFAGWGGETFRFFLRAFLDTASSLPGFLIALALSAVFPNSPFVFYFAALFLIFPWLTRFWESQMIKMQTEAHIEASRALGANPVQIFILHYFPELLRLLTSVLPFLVTRLLLLETSLSFLGLGTVAGHDTWGRLLYQGKDYLIEAPWILIIGALPLSFTLFSFHSLTRQDQS